MNRREFLGMAAGAVAMSAVAAPTCCAGGQKRILFRPAG